DRSAVARAAMAAEVADGSTAIAGLLSRWDTCPLFSCYGSFLRLLTKEGAVAVFSYSGNFKTRSKTKNLGRSGCGQCARSASWITWAMVQDLPDPVFPTIANGRDNKSL